MSRERNGWGYDAARAQVNLIARISAINTWKKEYNYSSELALIHRDLVRLTDALYRLGEHDWQENKETK